MKKIVITLLTVAMLTGMLMAFPREHGMRNNEFGYAKGNMEMKHHMGRGDFDRRIKRDGMIRKGNRGAMMQRIIFSQLDLTDNQMDKLDKIRSKYRLKNIELQGKIKVLAFQKREAIKNHKYDAAKGFVNKMADIRKTIANNRMDNIKEQWNVLTADQKKKADKLRKEHPYQMMHRFHNDDEEN